VYPWSAYPSKLIAFHGWSPWPPWPPWPPFCSCSGGCLPTGKASPTITRPGPDPRTPTPSPRSRPVLPRFPIGTPLRYRRVLSDFPMVLVSAWSMEGSSRWMLARLVLVCLLVWFWLLLGFRSVIVWLSLVLLVLACLLPFGSLVVRSSGLVVDRVDGVLNAWFAWSACLVCLDSFRGKEGPRLYIYRGVRCR
jgi:hypothetical protein